MKQHRIIHIILGKANPNRQNGVNKVVYELAETQCGQGHDVIVWGITKNLEVNFPHRTFTTFLFKDSKMKFKLSKQMVESIHKEEKGTIFHLHGAFLPQMYSIAKTLIKYGHSYIYTSHGAFNVNAVKRSKWKKQIYLFFFERFIVKNCRYIHTVGKSELKGVERFFGEKINAVTIPNGQEISTAPNLRKSLRKEEMQLAFIGRLDIETKGLDILLEGISIFTKEENKEVVLHVIGGGKEQKEFKKKIKALHIQKYVRMHGPLFGLEKKELLQQMDFVCLTSRNEGMPGVVLEALSMGIPCIVSKETNMGEFIAQFNAGFTLVKNTPEYLHLCLKKANECLIKKNRKEQSFNARRMIREKFQWSFISNRLIEQFYAK